MVSYDQIFENNRRWAGEKRRHDPQYFPNLAREQRPQYLFIGCSDSRVSAEDIMGAEPGEVFRSSQHRQRGFEQRPERGRRHRVRRGASEGETHHRLRTLQLRGRARAMQAEDLGLLNPWLRNIRMCIAFTKTN